MTLRTTSTPLDRLTETETRNTVAEWMGVSYDSLSAATQTELNRIIEETHEYVSQRMGHFPWAKREYSTTLSAGSQTLAMPADFRSMKTITETASGLTANARITDKDEWRRAWGTTGRATHPWSENSTASWFFDGMDDSTPPVQQWKRHATSSSAITVVFDYIPYFGLISSDSFTEIPAHASAAIRHCSRMAYAAFRSEYDKVEAEAALAERAISANQIADDDEGAANIPRYHDAPRWFYRETLGP